jgi:hypothetical protein
MGDSCVSLCIIRNCCDKCKYELHTKMYPANSFCRDSQQHLQYGMMGTGESIRYREIVHLVGDEHIRALECTRVEL